MRQISGDTSGVCTARNKMSSDRREEILSAVVDDPWIKVAGIDVDGVLRGKDIAHSKFVKAVNDSTRGVSMCSVIFGWDITDEVYGLSLSSRFAYTFQRLAIFAESAIDTMAALSRCSPSDHTWPAVRIPRHGSHSRLG